MASSAIAVRRDAAEPGSRVAVVRVAILAIVIVAWEITGRATGNAWVSEPSLIAMRLGAWIAGPLWINLATTLSEMALGLLFGVPAGILAGLVLGRQPVLASLLRPIIVTLYSIPLITLAPLLILWFGLNMKPKIVLVAVVSFFLLFFNTLAGAQAIDRDVLSALGLMGATRRELFVKVVLPASSAWIIAGLKIALPYALIATTVGEMIAARSGLGYLLTKAVDQVDMTGLYAALIVLMGVGVAIGELANRLERTVLRWRRERA